jgi:hypothetical protein
VVGIVDMIVSAVAAVVSAWILRRQEKAEGTDLERVSIKINRLRGMKKC